MFPTKKPLQYASLKCVMQYLDASLRIQLSYRAPSICSIEKMLPLKIEDLSLEPFCTKINGTEFKIGVARQLDDFQKYEVFEKDMEEGGIPHDLDENGVLDRRYERRVSRGDITFDYYSLRETKIEYQRLETLEFVLLQMRTNTLKISDPPDSNRDVKLRDYVFYKKGDTYLNDLNLRYAIQTPIQTFANANGSGGVTYKVEDETFLKITTWYIPKSVRRELCKQLERLISLLKHRLGIVEKPSFLSRLFTKKSSRPVPTFTCQILFTIQTAHQKRVERVLYTDKKIADAMKYVNNFIFANRRHPIQVNQLHGNDQSSGFLRLPPNLKLNVKGIKMDWNMKKYMESMTRIFSDASFPLKTASLSSLAMIREYSNPIVLSASKLIVSTPICADFWDSYFPITKNRVAYFTEINLLEQDYVDLIKNWLTHGKEIGTWFSFGMTQTEFGEEMLHLLREIPNEGIERVNGTSPFPYHITFPMGVSSQLQVYSMPARDLESQNLWELNIKVVNVPSLF